MSYYRNKHIIYIFRRKYFNHKQFPRLLDKAQLNLNSFAHFRTIQNELQIFLTRYYGRKPFTENKIQSQIRYLFFAVIHIYVNKLQMQSVHCIQKETIYEQIKYTFICRKILYLILYLRLIDVTSENDKVIQIPHKIHK